MRKTAGELCLKAREDSTRYDLNEVSHALTDDIEEELYKCARRHRNIFDEKEYFVGYVLAGDPLLKQVMRRKFHAMLYLPSPRPNQAFFLYNKGKDQITKRLWVLPNAYTMALLSSTPLSEVNGKYRRMKIWSDAFFNHTFWDCIRAEHDINHLSEYEYLKANREKLIQAGAKDSKPDLSQSLNFSKIDMNEIIDSFETVGK